MVEQREHTRLVDIECDMPDYPLEERRHVLWRSLVNEFAPALLNTNPPRVLGLPALPSNRIPEIPRIRSQIISDLSSKDTNGQILSPDHPNPDTITAQIAGIAHSPQSSIHSNFIKRSAEYAKRKKYPLGYHFPNIATHEGGTIFLPHNWRESNSWSDFFNLSNILGSEGQRLLISYFPDAIKSITDDLIQHADNQSVDAMILYLEDAGFTELLYSMYTHAKVNHKDAAAYLLINQEFGDTVPQDDQIAAALALGNIDADNKSQKRRWFSKIHNTDESSVLAAAGLLGCSVDEAHELSYKATGIVKTVEELKILYPKDKKRAEYAFALLMHMSIINKQPVAEATRNLEEFKAVLSRKSLQIIRQSFIDNFDADDGETELEGMSDPVLSHEHAHGLIHMLARQEGRINNAGRMDEEHVIEAINFTLGYEDAVRHCSYWNHNEWAANDIKMKAEKFAAMSPEEREQLLRNYVKTPFFKF